jgi:transcription elongation factor Elf1
MKPKIKKTICKIEAFICFPCAKERGYLCPLGVVVKSKRAACDFCGSVMGVYSVEELLSPMDLKDV